MIYKCGNLLGLQMVINKIKGKTFSLETQYKFLKILKTTNSEVDIYNEQLSLLIKQFAERDSNGKIISDENGIKINPEKSLECQSKIKELNDMYISFYDIFFQLEELDGLGLTLDDLIYLEPFIKH